MAGDKCLFINLLSKCENEWWILQRYNETTVCNRFDHSSYKTMFSHEASYTWYLFITQVKKPLPLFVSEISPLILSVKYKELNDNVREPNVESKII